MTLEQAWLDFVKCVDYEKSFGENTPRVERATLHSFAYGVAVLMARLGQSKDLRDEFLTIADELKWLNERLEPVRWPE